MGCDEHLVYDVGLHKGEDTDFYLKKGYKVVAFEANPSLVAQCRDRFSSAIEMGQLHIIEGAIAPPCPSGKVSFYVNDLSIWGTIDQAWVERNRAQGAESKRIEVNVVDLKECFQRFGVPYYIKIDIEGADGVVLDAIGENEDRPQFLSIEINTVSPDAIDKDVDALTALGYKSFQVVPQHRINGSFIQTSTVEGEDLTYTFPQDSSGPFGSDLIGAWIDRRQLGERRLAEEGWQDIHASLGVEDGLLLRNVAIDKPATQSSTSAWSTSRNRGQDAGIANNGLIEAPHFFHTGLEENPWWQVDLQGDFLLRRIVIFNRFECRDRLMNFSVLTSLDGRSFSELINVERHLFDIFSSEIIRTCVARFVRVRLNGAGPLHFRECQVFGASAPG